MPSKLSSFLNRIKRQVFSHVWLARLLLVILIISILVTSFFTLSPIRRGISSLLIGPEIAFTHLNGRTNFVVLGVGGPGHEAPDLTDTIIMGSLHLASGQVTLISLPRDIWIDSLKAKINSAYYYGRQKGGPDGGLTLAKAAVSEITNQPIHYAIVIDFDTFTKFIDELGGIEVSVERGFTDTKYPVAGRENDDCMDQDPEYLCRYETISFSPGPQVMDGVTALKFSRSRHSEDLSEGTDFARARRQSTIIKAIRDKLLSQASNPRNYDKFKRLYNLLSTSVITDFPTNQYIATLKLALRIKDHTPATFALSDPDQLYHPDPSPLYGNQWILLPRDNSPQVIFDYISSLLK
jgi:LCP family protein required for cell wall assembly